MLLSEYYNNPNAEIICIIKEKQQEYFQKDYLLYVKYFKEKENDYSVYITYRIEAEVLRKQYLMYLETLDAFR